MWLSYPPFIKNHMILTHLFDLSGKAENTQVVLCWVRISSQNICKACSLKPRYFDNLAGPCTDRVEVREECFVWALIAKSSVQNLKPISQLNAVTSDNDQSIVERLIVPCRSAVV